MNSYLFTSESVTEGHPDKLCDRVSDAVLDACLELDANARVACECFVKGFGHDSHLIVGGEISLREGVTRPDYEAVARQAVREIGYTDNALGMDADSARVYLAISTQSVDIALGVDEDKVHNKDQGAGDQGLMFGFASRETNAYLPMPIYLAHQLTMRLSTVRKQGILPWVRPDGKSQVSVRYIDGRPTNVEAVVVSTQHNESIELDEIRRQIQQDVIDPIISEDLHADNMAVHINPTGKFVIGGPWGDAGLTGRKIIVDTYGGMGRHGGGAFSGKDPSKVDRSAAYAARWVAKNLVAAEAAFRCEIQLAYAIGVAQPVSIMVNTFGTGVRPDNELERVVREKFDLRPAAIIERLNLKRPIYKETSSYGHFGREGFSWEQLDMVDAF